PIDLRGEARSARHPRQDDENGGAGVEYVRQWRRVRAGALEQLRRQPAIEAERRQRPEQRLLDERSILGRMNDVDNGHCGASSARLGGGYVMVLMNST